MDQFIKVAGTDGKVGGYFCRLQPLNENTVKTVLSGHSKIEKRKVLKTNAKIEKRKVLKTNGSLMQVKVLQNAPSNTFALH